MSYISKHPEFLVVSFLRDGVARYGYVIIAEYETKLEEDVPIKVFGLDRTWQQHASKMHEVVAGTWQQCQQYLKEMYL